MQKRLLKNHSPWRRWNYRRTAAKEHRKWSNRAHLFVEGNFGKRGDSRRLEKRAIICPIYKNGDRQLTAIVLEDVHTHLEVGAYKFNRVQKFKYLGTLITQNNIQEEIKARIHTGNRCYFGLNQLFKSRMLSKSLKVQLYEHLFHQWWCMDAKLGGFISATK